MEKEKKIIIIALVALIMALAIGIGYMLLNNVEYQTLALSNGTTIDAPKADDASWKEQGYGIRMYTSASKKTALTSFNSAENPNLAGAMGLAMARDALMNGSASVEKYKNYDLRENTVNGTHYYMVYISNNQTHDNVLIASENMDILKHMVDSLKFGNPKEVVNATAASQPTVSNNANTTNNSNKYSEEDMMRAAEFGYLTGYSDGYDNSYYYYDDYSDYDYSDDSSDYSSDSGYSSSSSSSDYYDDYDDSDYSESSSDEEY
ncbi:MAG: hypothetical protein IKH85_07050 [Methanobrevibacter sp.]|uniref:hypothetical protein n=1 Tax=Methanobrevibacter sp. TaxID=66852 RepID=UPI0025ECD30C|nr:hypothetical protein [Methanobrevibacter sp.]MBR6993814.1 hypothetical protein [Methanobrevibacter sp.]